MYKLLRPILFQFDAERSHNTLVKLGGFFSAPLFTSLAAPLFAYEHPSLETEIFGLHFKNPIGLAPGYDKAGGFARFMAALGFGFIEIGSITPLPQSGNPRPRLFRLEKDEAIVNRMGFNSIGMRSVAENLKRLENRGFVIGANLGKNKNTPNELAAADYLAGLKELGPLADYAVINVSSPNTAGLRELQGKENLRKLLKELQKRNHPSPAGVPVLPLLQGERVARNSSKPLLLKISPDLTDRELDDIIEVALETRVSGIIAVNTTTSREGLKTPIGKIREIGDGGLSGAPLRNRATDVISYLYRQLQGQIPIIGAGGIFTAAHAYEKIRAGASLVEIFTGLVYEGPMVVKRIKQGLAKLLVRDGFSNIKEAVGAGVK